MHVFTSIDVPHDVTIEVDSSRKYHHVWMRHVGGDGSLQLAFTDLGTVERLGRALLDYVDAERARAQEEGA